MGLGDYIWPFEKQFSKVPGAREGALSGLITVPVVAGVCIALRKPPKFVMNTSVYAGLGVFWFEFLRNRILHTRYKVMSETYFKESREGKLD